MFQRLSVFKNYPAIRNAQILPTGITFYSTVEFTQKELQRINCSWSEALKHADKIAVTFFTGLFKKDPDSVELFQKHGDTAEEIICNKKFMKEHAIGNILRTFGEVVAKLDEPCEATEMAKKLGQAHVKLCVTEHHLKVAKPVLMQTMVEVLGPDVIDCQTGKAWEKATNFIFDGLIKGLKQGQQPC